MKTKIGKASIHIIVCAFMGALICMNTLYMSIIVEGELQYQASLNSADSSQFPYCTADTFSFQHYTYHTIALQDSTAAGWDSGK